METDLTKFNEVQGSASISSIDDTDSPSSIAAEPTMSDSQEQVISSVNVDADKKAEEERKLRRVNRRKALALERSPLPIPKLGRILESANGTIDLTNEDDDPSNKWFKRTFLPEKMQIKPESPGKTEPFAVPRAISKSAPKSLLARERLRKKLEVSLSAKRRKEQEQRRRMYEEDNEHLKAECDDEEEEEDEVVFKKKKTKRRANDDSDDEEHESSENGDEESDYNKQSEKHQQGRADDEMGLNLLNDSFTYDVFNNMNRSGPGSISSNFDTHSQADPLEKNNVALIPSMCEIVGEGGSDELLNLYSGSFGTSQTADIPDTLQILMNEVKSDCKINRSENLGSASAENGTTVKPIESESDEEEDVAVKRMNATKTKRILESDDDDEDVVQKTIFVPSQDVFASEPSGELDKIEEMAESSGKMEEKAEIHLKRIVLDDEDSEEEEEEEEEVVDEEDVDDDDDEKENEEEGKEDEIDMEKENEENNITEPNFDDEDDELAVLKRLEYQEYQQKIKKRTLFDDEASLSGDDVGSDVEDEEGEANAYEAEEGDADDVPDDNTIRRQNHKLLLKQENDLEQRELSKLQERLLADGDLGGVETNRRFRFKIREEVEIQIDTELNGQEDEQEDDEPEENEQQKKERAEMIKYKIEHAEELMLLDDPKEDNDMFERAAKLLKKTEKTTAEPFEENISMPKIGKPSLLSKTSLAASFQEVLNGTGGAPKQMYVQNFEKTLANRENDRAREPTSAKITSKMNAGSVKRSLKSPDSSSAKRVRSSKLSFLE